jgi:hypothetical protein
MRQEMDLECEKDATWTKLARRVAGFVESVVPFLNPTELLES